MRKQTSLPSCLGIIVALALLTGCKHTAPPSVILPPAVVPQYADLLKSFFSKQEALARSLDSVAEAYLGTNTVPSWQEKVAPEVWEFFAAGRKGDWESVDRLYLSLARRSGQFEFPEGSHEPDLEVFVVWQPVNEAYWAFRELSVPGAQSFVDYAQAVRAALTDGAIYFTTSDVGRFMVECLTASSNQPPPFLLLSPNQFAGGIYPDYPSARYGQAIKLEPSWSQETFREYLDAAAKRKKAGTLKPGETVELAFSSQLEEPQRGKSLIGEGGRAKVCSTRGLPVWR